MAMPIERERHPRAVVLGAGVTALGVIRCLGRKRIPQVAIGTASSFVSYSRWYNRGPWPRDADPEPGTLPVFLDGLPEPCVLIPCSDAWAEAVASLPARLAERFPASIASAASIEIFVNKGRLAETLDALSLPHPRTLQVAAGDGHALSELGSFEDAFVKPCCSHAFLDHYGVKGMRFRGRDEAEARIRAAAGAGLAVMVQEYIPGPPTHHHFVDGFVDREGRVRALFARRRLRMWPQDFGNSTLMVSEPLEDVAPAAATLRRLLEALSYRGVFSAEFKYDPRDGLFKLLEVNPRPWWFVGFAASCGVDVCEMAYRDALGLPVETVEAYDVGRRCVYPLYDRHICWSLYRQGKLSLGEWARSWIEAEQPILSRHDPVPAVARFLEEAGRALKRRVLGDSR